MDDDDVKAAEEDSPSRGKDSGIIITHSLGLVLAGIAGSNPAGSVNICLV
jgi:hypothetical protein